MPLGGGSHLGKPHSYSKYIVIGVIGQSSLEPVAWPWSVVPKLHIRMDTLAIGRKSVIQVSFATPLKVQNGKRHMLQWGWLTGSEKPLSMGRVVGISPRGTS